MVRRSQFPVLPRSIHRLSRTRNRAAVSTAAGLLVAAVLSLMTASSVTAQTTPPKPQGLDVMAWGLDLVVDIEPAEDDSNVTCYYVRWRTAAQGGMGGTPAGAWQPGENGEVPWRPLRIHIKDLEANTKYDIEVRSYSESADTYSAWVKTTGITGGGSTDSALSALSLTHGSANTVATLTPAFEAEKANDRAVYRATVANSVESINLTATERTAGATIKVNGTQVTSGVAHAIALKEGKNNITIWVNAEDHRYLWFYQMEVTREAGTLAAPTNLSITQTAGPTFPSFVFTVTWTPPAGATGSVLEYRQVRDRRDNGWRSDGVSDLTTSGGTISAQLHGKELTDIRVASTNSSGTGAYASQAIRTYAPPDGVKRVSVTPGDQQLVVTWDPPIDSGGTAIQYYLVRHRVKPERADCCPWQGENGMEIAGTRVNSGHTHTITGLTNDTEYEVQVVAIAAFGEQVLSRRWSVAVSGTPTQTSMQQQLGGDRFGTVALKAPGRIVHLMLGVSGRRINVSWLAPERGGEPEKYIVRLKPTGGGDTKFKRPAADKQTVSFGNLQRGETYRVSVRAKNDQGAGRWSHAEITIPRRGQD